jgi:Kef-type K+ transport system membrane component KefB
MQPSILLLLGVALVGGTLGAWIFQRLRVPQVFGYIVTGIIVGETGMKLVGSNEVAALAPVSFFALGVIGFLVGAELEMGELRRHGRTFSTLLFAEGLSAFGLIVVLIGSFLTYVTGEWRPSFALALIFGAIGSATDPASTVSTLWETRARGFLTTTIIAIVALDDALALTLYAFATNAARGMLGAETAILHELGAISLELGGSLAVGALFAGGLHLVLRRLIDADKAFALSVGAILLVSGLARTFNLDLIIAAMMLGMVLRNVAGHYADDTLKVLRSFATPIYVLFFVLVGARFEAADLPWWLWTLIGLYLFGSACGKMTGMYIGARLIGAPSRVRRYAGSALLPQGGVAIGLALVAVQHFEGHPAMILGRPLGEVLLSTITATTLALQMVGPPMTRWAAIRAGEAGRDLTEDDLLAQWTVGDAMSAEVETLAEAEPLSIVVRRFGETDQAEFPVVSAEGELIGILPLHVLRAIIAESEAWDWLIAVDAMLPLEETLTPDQRLSDVVRRMRVQGLSTLPVVAGRDGEVDGDGRRLLGILDLGDVRRMVQEAMLENAEEQATGIFTAISDDELASETADLAAASAKAAEADATRSTGPSSRDDGAGDSAQKG